MSYAAITEGATEESRKDVDYALTAGPAAPPTRQKGVASLMGMLSAPPGRSR